MESPGVVPCTISASKIKVFYRYKVIFQRGQNKGLHYLSSVDFSFKLGFEGWIFVP